MSSSSSSLSSSSSARLDVHCSSHHIVELALNDILNASEPVETGRVGSPESHAGVQQESAGEPRREDPAEVGIRNGRQSKRGGFERAKDERAGVRAEGVAPDGRTPPGEVLERVRSPEG